ncbi:uncharacterized protein LOC135486420 isoform X3 [Lineus longissimus]|uniref:uncharacterized protein LOC135486420 isoform X3 n=1 Tax=Lineus longissimus TaxID=88925 RepID=UPI002B4E9088
MADTTQEYRFPLPNELESLNSYGQTGHYGQLGGPGQQAQHGQGQTRQHGQFGQPGVMSQPGVMGQPGHMGQPGVISQPGVMGQPGHMGQPGLMGQHGQIGQIEQSGQYGQVAHHGQPRQHSYRTEQRQVHHTVSSSSTGSVHGVPDVLGQYTNRAGALLQGPAAMPDVDFPPDVAAMMLVDNDNQKYDINEKHHDVVHGPHGSTEMFSKHQKRTGVNSMYENQEMMTFSTQQYDSSDPSQDDTAGEDQYVLRLVGATDVETGDHIGYSSNVTFGTDTPSDDSLSSFTRVNQQNSVSSQSQQNRYDSMHRSFSETSNVQTFSQHLAKIGQTEMEAVSLESLASFTQQQAKQWDDSPSDDSLSAYEQRQTKVGLTRTTETTRHSTDKVHTLPLQKPKYDTSQSLPPEKPHFNTMRHLVSESSINQDVKNSHVRTHSDQTFQAPDEKDLSNRNIKEYFSYDVRPVPDMSPASSVTGSRINVRVNITEPPPKVQSETVERTSSTTTQMVQGVEQKVTRRPPPPPVMPKPKTPDATTRGYDFTERLVIRGVIPVEDQAMSEESPDVTSDVFDPDIEAMLMGAGQQPPKQGEEHIEYVDGRCSCCPYGYHIDLTFLGHMADKENLLKLKKIKRNKRNLRKSMEVYMQSQDSDNQAPPPDLVHNESLLTMVEQDEKATKRILSEIDSSVNETIESIDTLIKSGPPQKRPKPPDPCDSDFSVSSGPQNTSSPRPAQSLNTSGSTSSLSSLDSTDKNAPQTLVQKTQNQRSNLHTEHHSTTTNITNIITSQQIAKSVEDCLNEGAAPSADPNVVTPDQLQAIRDQMKLSLQRMRDLEEQVKAIPVLQVRISVLKEEKRLLMLQMEAQKNRKPPTSNTRSIGVETDKKPRMRSVGIEANQKPTMWSVGVGECTVDEPESTTTGRRSRSQSPSGRSFEITEFQSYRRNNLTSMNKYFGKTGSGRSTPTFDGAETVDSAVGDGDVSKIYYIQPDLVTEAQFSLEMNSLRPDHVPELIRSMDKEQEEFDALERALATPVDEKMAQYSTQPTSRRPNERSEEFISLKQAPQQEFAQDIDEMVVPTYVKPRYMGNVPIVSDSVLKKESLHPEEEAVDLSSAPLQESQPVEDVVDAESVNDIQQPGRLRESHTAEYTHVHEKEVVYVNQAEVKVAPREVKQNIVMISKSPELKKASRTIGVGDGNVFEQPKPKIIKPVKPQTRSVGSIVQAATRDVGIMFESKAPEKPKPETREIGVGIGDLDEMKLIEVGEFGEYYHTVPMTEEVMQDRQQQLEKQQRESGVVSQNQSGGQSFGQRTIRTTSSSSYSERRNILLQEEKIKTALRDALHRSVKSVAIMCKMSSHDKGCSTDLVKKWDKGCGDDTVDVDIRPATEIRSIGIDVKPQRINKSTAIDKPFSYNAMTNTPISQLKDKSTNTAKVQTYPASIQTEVKRTYSVNLGTDMKVFMAMDQIKNTAVNTDTPTLRSAETNTERKALKSENYDFSIYFREGTSNTLETSAKDLKLTDRGQNTMKPEARDKEIEERIASEKARVAMYAPSNGHDSADGEVGSGSHSVTTRTVGYETSPQVIVNRRVVSQEYTESTEGSMPIGGFSQSAGGHKTSDGFNGSSGGNVSGSLSGSSGSGVSGSSGGNMSGSLSGSSSSGFSGSSGSNMSSGFSGSSSSGSSGSSGSNMSSGFSGSSSSGSSGSSGDNMSSGLSGSSSSGFSGSSGSNMSSGFSGSSSSGSSRSSGGSMSGGFSGSSSSGFSGSSVGNMSSGLSGSSSSGSSGSSGGNMSDGFSGSSSTRFSGSSGSNMSSGGRAESDGSTSRNVETVTRSTISNLQMGSGSSRSARMSGYGVSDTFPGGRFTKSSSSLVSSGGAVSGDGSANSSADRSVETVRGSAGPTLQMGFNMSAASGTGGEMDSLGAHVQRDSGSSKMSSSGSFTQTVSLSTGGTGAEHSTAAINLSGGHSSSTTESSGSSLREPLSLPSDSYRETDIIDSEVSSDLSSAPSVDAGLSLSGGNISTSGSVGTLSSGSSSLDGVSAGGQFVAKKPGSLNLSGNSSSTTSHAQFSTSSVVGSGETRISPSSRTKRRSSSERSIQEMMGGNLGGGESEITTTETSGLESGVGVTGGASMKGNADASLVFENKAVLSKFGGGSSGDGSESGFMSRSSSGRMLNLQEGEKSPAMTSSTGSLSEDSLGVTVGANDGATPGTGGRRVIVSSSETVTTYSSSEGSSVGSLDMIGEDQLSSLPGDTKNVTFGLEKEGDSDSEPSQSDVFGQENNGTIIRKHVVTTTRSSIPVRSSRKEVRVQQTVDQNGNKNSNRLSSGSPIRESGFGLQTSGSGNMSSLSYGSSPMGTRTIVEGSTEITHESGSLSSASPSSESGFGTGLSSYVSGVEFGRSPGSGFGYRSVSPGRSRTIVEGSTETTYSTGKHSLGSSGEEGFGTQGQSVGAGGQVYLGSSLSPGRTRNIMQGSTELTQSSSGGEKDLEVLAQLKELEKDIESSHAKHFESMGSEYESGSLEGDIEAAHNKHYESMKSKFLSGALHLKEKEHSETGESFLTTGAINLTPTAVSKLESSSITVTFGSSGLPKLAEEEDLENADSDDDEGAEGSSSPEMSKSMSEGSLERSGSSGGSTGSLKSIMKRSGSFEGNKGQRKEIKFAVGTMGGAVKTTEHVQSYVSTSSDDGTSETESESDSDTDTSYEEGSYDGRQGCIVYLCKDDEAIAQGIPGAKMFDQNIRETFDLNPEMKQSCIAYSEHLKGDKELSEEEQKVCMATIQAGWFKVSSERLSNPHQVEDYLSSFNELCRDLLPLIINQADANGNCAIHYAVSHCNFEIVSLLLDTEQCNVNAQNRAGYTPIMLASLAQVQIDRHKEIVRRLFREGDVNIKASQAGQTALMLAVSHGKKDMVKLLLDCGADINAQDEDGSTALMCASEHGHTDIVKVLLAQPECDPSIVDQDGSTALAIAMEAGHRDIAVLLYAKRGPKSPVRSPVSGFHQFKFKGKSPPH